MDANEDVIVKAPAELIHGLLLTVSTLAQGWAEELGRRLERERQGAEQHQEGGPPPF